MNKLAVKLHLGLISIFMLVSCNEKPDASIDFMEPQPAGVKDERSFKRAYQGRYFSATEQAFLEIQPGYMIRTSFVPLVFLSKDVDSSYTGGDTSHAGIIAALKKDAIKVDSFSVDSIYAHYRKTDTLFDFNSGDVCRFLKGDYFLSYAQDVPESWKVRRLHPDVSGLSFSYILPSDSLMAVLDVKDKKTFAGDSITPTRYQIKPDKKELKKLVKRDVFEADIHWIKIR